MILTAIKAAKHVRAAKVCKAITHSLGFQLITDPSLMLKRIRSETGYRFDSFRTRLWTYLVSVPSAISVLYLT